MIVIIMIIIIMITIIIMIDYDTFYTEKTESVLRVEPMKTPRPDVWMR